MSHLLLSLSPFCLSGPQAVTFILFMGLIIFVFSSSCTLPLLSISYDAKTICKEENARRIAPREENVPIKEIFKQTDCHRAIVLCSLAASCKVPLGIIPPVKSHPGLSKKTSEMTDLLLKRRGIKKSLHFDPRINPNALSATKTHNPMNCTMKAAEGPGSLLAMQQ